MSQSPDSQASPRWARSETARVLEWLLNRAELLAEQDAHANRGSGWVEKNYRVSGRNQIGYITSAGAAANALPEDIGEIEWGNRAISLAPPSFAADMVVLLTLRRSRHEEQPLETSVQVAFVSELSSEGVDSYKMYGFRFESPSPPSTDGKGAHSFCHVQPIRSIRGTKNLDIEPFLPEGADKGPTKPLPLRASRCTETIAPLALLLFAVLSLYGRDEWETLLSDLVRETKDASVQELLGHLKDHFELPS